MPISFFNPTVQRSLQEVSPAQNADLLNDSKTQQEHSISFAENLLVQPSTETRAQHFKDIALGAHTVSFGEALAFNPCKLIHMNYSFKA